MEILLNECQVKKAIEFFKPEVWAEVNAGDVYIDTITDEIVFMGVNYPVSYSLKDTKFVLNCEEEPLRLNAVVKMCDCNFGYTKIFDQYGNTYGELTVDLWGDEDAESAVIRFLREKGIVKCYKLTISSF